MTSRRTESTATTASCPKTLIQPLVRLFSKQFCSLQISSFPEKGTGPNSSDKTKDDSTSGPILYCAPTGKAASVIKKRVGSKAFTIHQIISSYKIWRQGEMLNPWKFSPVQIVAVDECR